MALGGFWWWSADATSAGYGLRGHPPLYGIVAPRWGSGAVLALLLGSGCALLAARAPRGPRGLVVLVPAALLASAAVNSIRGLGDAARSLQPSTRFPDYGLDAGVLDSVGAHAWLRDFPDLYAQLRSPHTRSHPPGALLLYETLRDLPGGVVTGAVVMAVLTVLMAVPAYVLVSSLVGPRAAFGGAALVAFSPAVLTFALTSLDGVFATVLASCAAVLAVSAQRGSWLGALAGGFALGLSTFLTYAGAFVAIALGLYVLMTLRGPSLVRWVTAATGGALGAVLLLRLVGFDLLACYAAVDKDLETTRRVGYWVLGTPAVYLMALGVPLAALALLRLGARRPPLLPLALLAPMLVFALLPASITGLVPGEIERTWMFTMPVTAVLGADRLHSWEEGSGPWRGRLLAALLLIAVTQAVLVNGQYDTYW